MGLDAQPTNNVVHLTHDEGLGVLYVALQDEYEGPSQTIDFRDRVRLTLDPSGRLIGMQITADVADLEVV
jgi:hypothetical protein